jgi:RNA polymerase sigma factor (sigma-70 family)
LGSFDEPEADEVWQLVQALPTVQRAVVVLRFYEDLGVADIALLLGRPPSTVRSDLRRALTKLKEQLV